MKKYLAVYLGTPEKMMGWKPDEATMKAGMDAWGKWMEDHKAAVVDQGAPLGKTKQANASGISDTKNEMGAYAVVQAESHDEAVKMFENHPHFTIFPGDRVEVMECLPMPKME